MINEFGLLPGSSLWALGLEEETARQNGTSSGTPTIPAYSSSSSVTSFVKRGVMQPPSLSKILLSIRSDQDRMRAVRQVMQALKILFCREAVLSALQTSNSPEHHHEISVSNTNENNGSKSVEVDVVEDAVIEVEPTDQAGVKEEEKKLKMLETIADMQPETITSVDQLGVSSPTSASVGLLTSNSSRVRLMSSMSGTNDFMMDNFAQLVSRESQGLMNLLRMAIPSPACCSSRGILTRFLSMLAKKNMTVADSVVDVCVSILDEIVANSPEISSDVRNSGSVLMQPVLQESDHPYRSNSQAVGAVTIPGARFLRIQFDTKCRTEPNLDVLTLMDGENNVIEQLSGRNYKDWNEEICIIGDTVKWRFSASSTNTSLHKSHGACNITEGSTSDEISRWGWCFMVFPSGATCESANATGADGKNGAGVLMGNPNDLLLSDKQALRQPCFEVVREMLDRGCLNVQLVDSNLVAKLALALASCAQLSCLGKILN